MRRLTPAYISCAVSWVAIGAAVIYGIHKTGSLMPLWAFIFGPTVKETVTTTSNNPDDVTDQADISNEEDANGTN